MERRIKTIFSLVLFTALFSTVYCQNNNNIDVVEERIREILAEYKTYSSEINNQTPVGDRRGFINLFHNARVLVYKDFSNKDMPDTLLRLEDYIDEINTMFPNGLDVKMNTDNPDIRKPKRQSTNRYYIDVYISKEIFGFYENIVFSRIIPLIFTFGYDIENEVPENVCIYGITKARMINIQAGFHINPALTNIVNLNVFDDARFNFSRRVNYNSGLEITWFINNWIGFGSGVDFCTYQNSLKLHHFDPLGDFDPNMIEINMINTLQYLEIPFLLKLKTSKDDSKGLYLNTGVRYNQLIGRSFTSTATNKNNYQTRENVISDELWKEYLNRSFLSGHISFGVLIPMGKNAILNLGGNYVQGLVRLETYSADSYSDIKYKGGINPLYGEPSSHTVNQSFGIELGVNFIL